MSIPQNEDLLSQMKLTSDRKRFSAHLSDLGNGYRFYLQHHRYVRYCAGQWLIFDGCKWAPAGLEIEKLAKETVKSIYSEAGQTNDQGKRTDIANFARRSESVRSIQAMLTSARSELSIDPEQFDADPTLLNCNNGTLNLKTGELRPHNAADYLSKSTGLDYDPSAHSQLWEDVLAHALPDRDVRNYLQMLAGYSLVGLPGEDLFVLIYGPTRTSKGTVLDAILNCMGDYGCICELDLLTQRRDAGGPRPELVRLKGVRMAAIFETSSRMKMSASLVKSLSGSDPITARGLNQPPITFQPQLTLWLGTNYAPQVQADDNALFERVKVLPFEQQLAKHERRRSVRADLLKPEHARAVLKWAADGAYMWLNGVPLEEPQAVLEATRAYQSDSSSGADAYLDQCAQGPMLWTLYRDLRNDYERWCDEQSEEPISPRDFQNLLKSRGFTSKTNNAKGGRGWQGVRPRGQHLQIAPVTSVTKKDTK